MIFLDLIWDARGVLRSLVASITELVYKLIAGLYNLFIVLSQISLFKNKEVETIYKRVEVILAVIMVFYVSFQFVKYIVNPEAFSDKEKGAPGLIKKMVIVVFLMGFGTSIFATADKIRNTIITKQVLPQLIFQDSANNNDGYNFSSQMISLFYKANPDLEDKKCDNVYSPSKTVKTQLNNFSNGNDLQLTFCIGRYDRNRNNDNKFDWLVNLEWLYAILVGGFIVWVLINYCVEAAKIVFQLALLEIIAPIPIISYLSPDKDGMFQKWGKQVLTTYLDLIVRLFIIYLMMYFCDLALKSFNNINEILETSVSGDFMQMLVKIFLIIGLLYFAMQAPKLLKELLPKGMAGLAGNFGFGTKSAKERFNPSSRFAGAALGATRGAKGLARGIGAFGRNVKKNGLNPIKNGKDALKSIKAGARRTRKRVQNAVDRALGNDEASREVRAKREALDRQLELESASRGKNGKEKLQNKAFKEGLSKDERDEFNRNNVRMSELSNKKKNGTITAVEEQELATLRLRQSSLFRKVQGTEAYGMLTEVRGMQRNEMAKYLESNKNALKSQNEAKIVINESNKKIQQSNTKIENAKKDLTSTDVTKRENAEKTIKAEQENIFREQNNIAQAQDKINKAEREMNNGRIVASYLTAIDDLKTATAEYTKFNNDYNSKRNGIVDTITAIEKSKKEGKTSYEIDGKQVPIKDALLKQNAELSKLEADKVDLEKKRNDAETAFSRVKANLSTTTVKEENKTMLKDARTAAALSVEEKVKEARKQFSAAEAMRIESYAREKEEMREEAHDGYHSVIGATLGGIIGGTIKGATQGTKTKEITKVIPDYVKGVKQDIKDEAERQIFYDQGGTTGVTASAGRIVETVKHAIGVGTTSEQLQSSIKPLQQMIEVDKKVVDANGKATSSYSTAKSTLVSAREGNKLKYEFAGSNDDFKIHLGDEKLAHGSILKDVIKNFDSLTDTRQVWQALKNRAEILDAKFKAFSELKPGDVGYYGEGGATDADREDELMKLSQAVKNAQDDEKKFATQIDRKVASLYLNPATRNSSNLIIGDPGVRTSIDALVSTLRAALDNPSTYAELSKVFDANKLLSIKNGTFIGVTMDDLNDLNDRIGEVNQGINDRINGYSQKIELAERAMKDAKLQEDGPKSGGGDSGKK